MIDLNNLKIEPFEVKINDEVFNLTGLKLCDFEKLMKLPTGINGTLESAVIILNANDKGRHFTKEEIAKLFSYKQVNAIVTEYYKWLSDTKSNPN